MKKFITVILAFALSHQIQAMDTPALMPYDIPYDATTEETPGGSFSLEKRFKDLDTGQIVTAYAILQIPINEHPEEILDTWIKKYNEVHNFPSENYEKILYLKAAQMLNLPIPPEARDTSNTPNYDAFMDSFLQSYKRLRPTHISVPIPPQEEAEPEEEDESCILL